MASRPVVFSQGIRSPRLSGMRAADSRWRGTGWHGNRLGDRDWHRHRYSNRIAFFRGGYSPYSYGSYSRNWDYGYPYYQTAWDYSGYGGGYNSDYPYYNTTYSAPAYYGAPATTNRRARVTQIQRQLAAEGYYRGPIDGILGPMTRAALYAYQQDH
ncbi:MAG: peptidoglycan-binding protein [Verrucomicrobiota bacterium]